MGPSAGTPPLVSVLVITYQHARFIEACLEGILMQRTPFAVEILVGEDDSTDGTRAICQRYAAAHPERIRLFLRDRKDVWMIDGRPTGRANMLALMRDARGTYIALCEGDDVWTDPDKLRRQVELLESDPGCAGSFHATRIIDDQGRDLGRLMRDALPDRLTVDDVIGPLAPFHTSSFMFRAVPCVPSVLAFPRTVASFDMALFTLVAAQGPLRRVDGVMSAYRKHPGGVTARDTHKGVRIDQHRILLWMHLTQRLHRRHAGRCERLVEFHWRNIVRQATPRVRAACLLEQWKAVPSWYLRRPLLSLRRAADVLRG